MFVCVAPGAHAVMYKWIDAEGTVTYSNSPPPDPGQVRDLTKIENINTAPADKPPQEAIATEKQKGSGHSAVATPEAAPPATRPDLLPRHPDSPVTSPDTRAVPRDSTVVKSEPATLPSEPERAPPVTRSVQTEAVRDPCLRSSDPKCHQRNKDRYHPYLGYSPGTTQPVPPAVGASSANGAGGAVGGSVRR